MIYLDAAAAERPAAVAISAAAEAAAKNFANPNASHVAGRRASQEILSARERIGAALNCAPEQIHFAPTASVALDAAVKAASAFVGRFLYPRTEHASAIGAAERHPPTGAAERRGIIWMLANNETGEIFTPPKILRPGDLWICDATAAVGHMPVDFSRLGCDYLICDALKFGGLPGCAAVIVAHSAPTPDATWLGTPSLPLIASFAAALEERTSRLPELQHQWARQQHELRQRLSAISGYRDTLSFAAGNILPNILNCSFDGVEGEVLALALSERGVMVSTGAACRSGQHGPSPVVLASGVPEAFAAGAIRISLSADTTDGEIEEAAAIILQTVADLRRM